MREFFRGWRRKVGYVTLVMACAFMGMWIRSHAISDLFIYKFDRVQETVESLDGDLIWERREASSEFNRDYSWISEEVKFARLSAWVRFGIKPQWEMWGVEFGQGQISDPPNTERFGWLVLPYWSVTVPLTILSAYLILWKSRKVGAGQNCEPSAAETTQQSLTDFRRK